jgi:hypothetical protein
VIRIEPEVIAPTMQVASRCHGLFVGCGRNVDIRCAHSEMWDQTAFSPACLTFTCYDWLYSTRLFARQTPSQVGAAGRPVDGSKVYRIPFDVRQGAVGDDRPA